MLRIICRVWIAPRGRAGGYRAAAAESTWAARRRGMGSWGDWDCRSGALSLTFPHAPRALRARQGVASTSACAAPRAARDPGRAPPPPEVARLRFRLG